MMKKINQLHYKILKLSKIYVTIKIKSMLAISRGHSLNFIF